MSSSWRPEEDERLLAAVKQHGDDWTEIALAVAGGRSRKACRNRHRRLTVEDVEDVNPLAVLQTRRDPVTGAPGGPRVFDMESGREFTEEMDAIYQDVRRMFGAESGGSITPEGMHAMLEETLAQLSSHGISTRIVDSEDMDALLQEQDEPLTREELLLQEELEEKFGVKFVVGPPPEASAFDQAVAALSLQFGARCEDADEKAYRTVRSHVDARFGADADVNSPEVDAFLREYVELQMRHLTKRRPASKDTPAGNPNMDKGKERIAHEVPLGPNGRLVRVTVVRDKRTAKETIDEAYSDMDLIEKHLEPTAAACGLTAREYVRDSRPWDLLHILAGHSEGISPNEQMVSGKGKPCQWTVRQNVERLYGITGHPITAGRPIPYVRTPTQVLRGRKWKDMPHRHQYKAPGSDKDDRSPYKNGLTMRYKDDQILINEFSVWMGKSWVHSAILIDTTSDEWKVVDYVFFCYGKDINNGKPCEENSELPRSFEDQVSSFIQIMHETIRLYGASYTWSTAPKLDESLCIPRRDSDNYPILIETKKPIVHSARVKSTTVPESYARRLRSGEAVVEVAPNFSL
jgi:hypothetical protein